MNPREILARNVRRLRAERGMSQEKLGFEAEISMTYVSHIETEKFAASIDVVGRIAKALKVTLSELVVEPVKRRRSK